jgi:hypothetical protein
LGKNVSNKFFLPVKSLSRRTMPFISPSRNRRGFTNFYFGVGHRLLGRAQLRNMISPHNLHAAYKTRSVDGDEKKPYGVWKIALRIYRHQMSPADGDGFRRFLIGLS